MKKIPEKTTVLVLGFLATLVIVEVVLRVVGFIHVRDTLKEVFNADEGTCTILCVGDSFTYGFGADRNNSYPKHLERILKNNYTQYPIRVINRGVGGYNTAYVLYGRPTLEELIEKTDPDILIFLAGGQNLRNFWGCKKYLKDKEKGSYFSFYELLEKIKVYKLVKLLAGELRHTVQSFDIFKKHKINQKKIFTRTEAQRYTKIAPHIFPYLYDEDTASQSNAGNKRGNKKVRDYCRLGMEKYDELKRDEALVLFQKSIDENPDDPISYKWTARIFREKGELKKAIEWYKKVLELSPEDSAIYRELGNIYILLNQPQEAIKWCKAGIPYMKGSAKDTYSATDSCYFCLGSAYKSISPLQAIEWYKKAVKFKPYDFEALRELLFLFVETGKYEEGVRFLEEEIPHHPYSDYFSALLREKKDILKTIQEWIVGDTQKLIEICQREGIKVIMQDYPFVDFSKPLYTSMVNESLEEVALENEVVFVDHRQVFAQLLRDEEDIKRYISRDMSHPNSRGYKIMAENLYEAIAENNMIEAPDRR